MTVRLLFVSFILVTVPAYGQWSGEGDLGYSNASGNTESTSLTASLGLNYNINRWEHAARLRAIKASQNDVATGERYTFRGQSDYRFSDDAFAFGAVRYENDRFSGYEYQSALNLGLGYRLINTESRRLTGELGAGVRHAKLAGNLDEENEVVGSAAVKYTQQLTQSTDIDASVYTEAGDNNRYSEISLGLRVAISDALGLRTAWQAKQNSDAPVGTRKTDTLLTVGLNYRF